MKVLVAVKPSEPKDDDFCFVPDGEILYEQAITCSGYKKAIECGCGRSLSGTTTPKATTTMEVREVDLTDDDLFALAAEVGKASGWGGRYVLHGLDRMREAAEEYPVGTLVRARISVMHDDKFIYYTDEEVE